MSVLSPLVERRDSFPWPTVCVERVNIDLPVEVVRSQQKAVTAIKAEIRVTMLERHRVVL